MKNIIVDDIIRECNGKLIIGNKQEKCENFVIDSRIIKEGDIYVVINSEKRNGNIFCEEALKKGAKGCIVNINDFEVKKLREYEKNGKFIVQVKDTIEAVQKLSSYKRNLYDIPVIAITGSVGKTSTKDMVASVISQKYNVLKTEGNMNNHIGLPLTILRLKNHEALCVEMGMNHLKEISLLTNIAKPTIAIITNVGTSHIGNLGSRENILKAKLEILEGLKENGTLIINNDNDMLNKWSKNAGIKQKIITYGIETKSEIMPISIEQSENNSIFNIDNCKIEVPIGGIHFIYNALCAICVGKILDIPIEKIAKGIKEFELTKNRMEISKLKNGITLINDCYNANYDSMKDGLDYLGNLKNTRKIAVLGDMLELGKFSEELHIKVGEQVIKNNINILITVGEFSKMIAEKSKEKMSEVYICNNNEQAIKILCDIMKPNDTIYLKASHSMNFNEIGEKIKDYES